MKHHIIFALVLFSLSSLKADYNDFEKNQYITSEAREDIRPYLLPEKHPMKSKLDKIFHSSRASFDDQSLTKAGFDIKFKQPRSFIRVVSHPSLPGYLLKIVTDVELRKKNNKPEWHWFVNRCKGVQKIHDVLQKNKIKYFAAPKKWIYPLPLHPYPSKNAHSNSRKIVVLLVEDMELTSKHENLSAWRKVITKEHLDELYTIISRVGGHSYRASNIPHTKNGKFAFIDTEYPKSPPGYGDIMGYLSPKRQLYWERLVRTRRGS